MSLIGRSASALTPFAAILVSAQFVSAQFAWAQPDNDRYYGHHMWDGGWGMVFGPLMMISLIVAIVVVVVLVVRWLGGAGQSGAPLSPQGKSPVDILKERFARGEIDKDEFEERRRILE